MTERRSVAIAIVDTTDSDTTDTGTTGSDTTGTGTAGGWLATVRPEHEPAEQIGPTSATELVERLRAIDAHQPVRWTWWGHDTAVALAQLGFAPTHCWDLAAVHRLVSGTWRSDPAHVWATALGLDPATIPAIRPDDLFHAFDDRDHERHVDDSGHLAAEWVAGAWADTPARRATWLEAAHDVRRRQHADVAGLVDRPAASVTVRSESVAAMLAAELEVEGLPVDVSEAEALIAGFIGPRPTSFDHERSLARARDASVLRFVPDGDAYDLRSPDQVRSMLRRCGIEVPDTRSWRLERLIETHPVVRPLLEWRRAERIATTFGYRWLDEHVRATWSGTTRLHGVWSSSDGAAGRMTASAGLHNMPAELRPAVRAEPAHLFVRADLGQIEPRVLAAVSGDERLINAANEADMYAPVAAQLGVDREVAKVAVLGAMYGQTTGVGAAALRGLEQAYPVAMRFLADADRAAQGGNDLRTIGGRLVRLSAAGDGTRSEPDARARAAARGRFGRNAMIQGAAAEFFKTWAVLVRLRGAPLGARIVLCLHDELLVHAPAERAGEVADVVDSCLAEAAARWAPGAAHRVRFVTDTAVIERWSEAK